MGTLFFYFHHLIFAFLLLRVIDALLTWARLPSRYQKWQKMEKSDLFGAHINSLSAFFLSAPERMMTSVRAGVEEVALRRRRPTASQGSHATCRGQRLRAPRVLLSEMPAADNKRAALGGAHHHRMHPHSLGAHLFSIMPDSHESQLQRAVSPPRWRIILSADRQIFMCVQA